MPIINISGDYTHSDFSIHEEDEARVHWKIMDALGELGLTNIEISFDDDDKEAI